MRKLPSSGTSRLTPPALLLTTVVSLTLLLGSVQVGVDQTGIQNWFGQATISTENCSGAGGLCQGGDPTACSGGPGPNCPACNNGAGPNPAATGPNPTPIQATVTLCESRVGGVGTLAISGTGTGFVFGKTYVSLLYFNGNTATCSRFPATTPPTPPTLQNIPLADNDFGSMHLGFWVVNPDGSGRATLNVVKQATVSGLNNYKPVSVREMQPPNLQCFNCGLDPAPQLNALRACGALTVVQGGCTLLCPPYCPPPI
jgi:hypothetical protein